MDQLPKTESRWNELTSAIQVATAIEHGVRMYASASNGIVLIEATLLTRGASVEFPVSQLLREADAIDQCQRHVLRRLLYGHASARRDVPFEGCNNY